MTLRIRSAVEKDIPFILKGSEIINQMTGDSKASRYLTADHLRQDVFSSAPIAFVAVAESRNAQAILEPTAFILYSFFYLANEGQVAWVSRVYIDPFSRKTDVGPLLRDYIFEKHPHVSRLYGAVGTNNKNARVFFASLGGENLNKDYVYYVLKRD